MKRVIIFIDTEEPPPNLGKLNFEYTMFRIMDTLEEYKAKAVFFSCAYLIEKYPDCFKEAMKCGHEIECHGYKHENFLQLNNSELRMTLDQANKAFRKNLGFSPTGLRSPWLKKNKMIYEIAREKGYSWASNVSQQPVVLALHDPLDFYGSFVRLGSAIIRTARRLHFGTEPYRSFGLIEIPLLSSFPEDLLNVFNSSNPDRPISEKKIRWAYTIIQKQYYLSSSFFNLNFHSWWIGSTNGSSLLARIIEFILSKEDKFLLPREVRLLY
jgi:peptidoglycan/xylan/chitin deacetylase (PgdA/CDA1 family)